LDFQEGYLTIVWSGLSLNAESCPTGGETGIEMHRSAPTLFHSMQINNLPLSHDLSTVEGRELQRDNNFI
jgi:hypothetical protein